MTSKIPNKLYRFRSTKKLFEHKELENQEIYFCPIDKQNDPYEGKIEILFKGDEIIWMSFFRNYLFFIHRTLALIQLGACEKCIRDLNTLITNEYVTMSKPESDNFSNIKEKFIKNPTISMIISELSKDEVAINQIGLSIILSSITQIAVNLISEKYNIDTLYNITKNHKVDIEMLRKQIIAITKIKKDESYIVSKARLAEYESINIKFEKENNSTIFRYLLLEIHNNYISKLEKLVRPDCYISCFMSEDATQNTTFWGHYADSHDGVCLIFNTKKGLNENIFLESFETYPVSEFMKVNYFDYNSEFPKIDFFTSIGLGKKNRKTLDIEWYKDEMGNYSDCKSITEKKNWLEQYKKNIYKSITTKTKEWQLESEWRLCIVDILNSHDGKALKYKFKDLDGIIFGINMSLDDKIKIIDIIKKKLNSSTKDFNFYQAFYNPSLHKVEKVKLTI